MNRGAVGEAEGIKGDEVQNSKNKIILRVIFFPACHKKNEAITACHYDMWKQKLNFIWAFGCSCV